ncbi:MAG: hypothetical protein B5766_12955 [Candidatus Lumbricidophila eiseniae]|uniref:Fibronectin type-III domain-containing protein n=1 Tax=Candidatus Lumbricidiphila eiseniae TaxID=1969409 RepID=A0A2A6FMM5_9MICO|nr:MAG: hypothetical protein B5766_12955 [Candidatus Lumbricidophila eiseniae]
MSDFDTGLAAGYVLRLTITQDTQNDAANSTVVGWSLRIIKGRGSGKWAQGPHYWSVNIGGTPASGQISAYNFRSYQDLVLGSGQVSLGHDAAGYLTASTTGSWNDNNRWGELGDGEVGGHVTFSRIPKVPDAPTPISIDQVTSSSLRYRFHGNADNGAGILQWQAQCAQDSEFSAGAQTLSSDGTTTFSNLVPGYTYWVRSRGRNSQGWSPWSGSLSTSVGLPAPTLTGWTQNSSGHLVATWSPPTATNGLIGYRLQLALDANFSAGVQNFDLDNVLTHTVTGLAGGRVYYARVAARTAGGTNAYSTLRHSLLVLAAGDLDGWTRTGTVPAPISSYTTEGLRRGTIGTTQALWVESVSQGSTTLPDTVGIQKTLTGLTAGRAYRFEAAATLENTPLARSYQLRVVGESTAPPVTLTTTPTSLGFIEFVADTTTVTLQILLATPVTVPGPSDAVERVAFHTIRLLELRTDYPQRLRETVLESDLATHFDLACNSVGASWHVGRDGITRFLLPATALPTAAVFSDQPDATAHSYIDITAGHDTKALTNRLVVTNYGVDQTRQNEQNDELVMVSQASITAYGTRSQTLRTNLYSQPPYDTSLTERLGRILDARNQPALLVAQLRINAQQNLTMASSLDVGQRITVRFNTVVQDSQIIAISHNIQPTRWLITLDLHPLRNPHGAT